LSLETATNSLLNFATDGRSPVLKSSDKRCHGFLHFFFLCRVGSGGEQDRGEDRGVDVPP
jgi:hypothetical protein